MSLYDELKKSNHNSLTIEFRMRQVRDKTNYKGLVAESSLLQDARKRKADRAKNHTLDKYFTPPTITN